MLFSLECLSVHLFLFLFFIFTHTVVYQGSFASEKLEFKYYLLTYPYAIAVPLVIFGNYPIKE